MEEREREGVFQTRKGKGYLLVRVNTVFFCVNLID